MSTVLLASLCAVGAQSARAQDAATPAPPATEQRQDQWEFVLAPYLWASSLRSTIDAGPVSATTEACFSDLVQQLDFGAQLRFEGLRNNWGFYLDGTYMKLGNDTQIRAGKLNLWSIDASANVTEAWLDFGGIYRFGDRHKSFDVLFGGRYTHLAADATIGPFEAFSETTDFMAPLVGGRFILDLSKRWTMGVHGSVGGFGIGESADLIVDASVLLGYRLNDRTLLGFGYRYADIEFGSDELDARIQFHGPVVGVAFRF